VWKEPNTPQNAKHVMSEFGTFALPILGTAIIALVTIFVFIRIRRLNLIEKRLDALNSILAPHLDKKEVINNPERFFASRGSIKFAPTHQTSKLLSSHVKRNV
jgi:hypothetical protein